MNNGLTKEGYGDLQKLADLANEAETLRRENSALRAELKHALESCQSLDSRVMTMELSRKDEWEAYRVAVERIKRLEDAITRALGQVEKGYSCPVEWLREALEVTP